MHLVTLCKALGGGWESRFGAVANAAHADTATVAAHGAIVQTSGKNGGD
ncbi:hypothetical protein [Burkholderia sp. IMCC1007]|nr:hypothetical protein [Burkholderia sp. IMCC1007]